MFIFFFLEKFLLITNTRHKHGCGGQEIGLGLLNLKFNQCNDAVLCGNGMVSFCFILARTSGMAK